MSIIARPAPMISSPVVQPDWRSVILAGPYLKRMRCQLLLDAEGNIVDCDRIHSAFSGSARFGSWFTHLYHPVPLGAQGFGMSQLNDQAEHPDAQRDNGE